MVVVVVVVVVLLYPWNKLKLELSNVKRNWIHETELVHCNLNVSNVLNLICGGGSLCMAPMHATCNDSPRWCSMSYRSRCCSGRPKCHLLKIHQRGVQWKQGVVVYIISYAVVLYNTTSYPLHPPPTAPPSAEYPDLSAICVSLFGQGQRWSW